MQTDGRRRILAGWVVDGRGSPVRRNVCLAIERGRISRLDEAGLGEGVAFDVDLGDCTLIPGLVDSHVHLCMSGSADRAVREWQLHAAFEQMQGVIERHLDQHLASGVAAVRDGGDYAAHVLRYKQTLPHGPRNPVTVHAAGRAWRRSQRYGKLIGRPPAEGQTLARAIADSREAVNHVKIVNSGLNSLKQFGTQSAPQFSEAELRAAVRAAGTAHRRVMVHVNGREPVRRSIAAGCHSIEHGFFMGAENLKRLADAGTFWVPTAGTMQGYCRHAARGSREAEVARRNLDHQLEQIQQARALGVRIAAGTDAGTIGVHHGTALGDEIALLLAAGFTIPGAVQCATGHGAELMALTETGMIEPGLRATLLALPGSPEAFPQNLANPVWFMIDGQVIFDHRL